ncbi:hypothetical protein VB735_07220 [Halotia wernerae UHCC 0503]|nr:hypothetical protein [Halotia wernerae UHCC 0503]
MRSQLLEEFGQLSTFILSKQNSVFRLLCLEELNSLVFWLVAMAKRLLSNVSQVWPRDLFTNHISPNKRDRTDNDGCNYHYT